MKEILLRDESFKLIGVCMEIHKELGFGFREAVYKEAIEIEFAGKSIPFEREKLFMISYKGIQLRQKYSADFIVFGKIVLEVKATSMLVDAFLAQTINYLKASHLHLGIIVNFGQSSLTFKRVVL